jgi:hypothetical protein
MSILVSILILLGLGIAIYAVFYLIANEKIEEDYLHDTIIFNKAAKMIVLGVVLVILGIVLGIYFNL